ncbi:hypothetical protein N2W52_002032 [Clostridium perfringens]|nr:hypothetical protein [Clostridium perfringens]
MNIINTKIVLERIDREANFNRKVENKNIKEVCEPLINSIYKKQLSDFKIAINDLFKEKGRQDAYNRYCEEFVGISKEKVLEVFSDVYREYGKQGYIFVFSLTKARIKN